MRRTEAVAALVAEYPKYSKNKLKTALKIEESKGLDVADALEAARQTIATGALEANAVRQHTDPTANEVQTRIGKSDKWKAANPTGYMATKGIRPGLTDSEIAEADKEAEKYAEAWRRA